MAGAHPAELLHDLFGSAALIRSATGACCADEQVLLHRPIASVDEVEWTAADVALLDDAREALGPRPNRAGKIDDADEILIRPHRCRRGARPSPMELKMVSRRSPMVR